MAKILTGVLMAHSTVRHNSGTQAERLDFSLRPPVGAILDRVYSQFLLNDVAGVGSGEEEGVAELSLDPDAAALQATTVGALGDLFIQNSDVLFTHQLQFDGAASASGGAAGPQSMPPIDLDFGSLPDIERPIFFRNLSHVLFTGLGVEIISVISLYYRLAEFTNDEIGRFSAGRV